MRQAKKDLVLLSFFTIFSTLIVWLPFFLGLGGKNMLTVFANYDGPYYLVVAKTLYEKSKISSTFSLPTPLEYYPAHFPAYPLLIKLFNLLIPGPWAMLLVTVLSTCFAVSFFYLLLKKFRLSINPFWLSICFLFLPARWLVVRSVGSPEPLFIGCILASFYFFKSAFNKKENDLLFSFKNTTFDFFLSGLFGALAMATKTPGILLFISYIIYLLLFNSLEKKFNKQLPSKVTILSGRVNCDLIKKLKNLLYTWPLLIIPFPILPIFWFYKIKTGDFLAYFHSGDNFHLVFPPFQSFITGRNWIGDFWLEDMVYIYFLGALAIFQLIKLKHLDLATFAGVFFAATLFISHRDLSRYSLPLMPFSLIAFSPLLEKKEFRPVFFFILIPIYLYSINFISQNIAPIDNWTPYL